MMPNSSAAMPNRERTAPTGSSGVAVSSLLRGAKIATATSTITGVTALTTKADPHQNEGKIHQPVRRNPTRSGPSAPPAPANPAQTAIALPRSCGGNTAVSNDRVAGMMSAAPIPEMERDAMTWFDVSASAPMSDPPANTASPTMSARFRPNRSPIAPALRSSPANTIA